MVCRSDPEALCAYELFELPSGTSVYRRRGATDGLGGTARYWCPECHDAGREVALVREESVAVVNFVCPHCNTVFPERKKPLSGLAMSPWG